MKKYHISVIWEMWGSYEIEASSLEGAIEIANHMMLPHNKEYIDDSFRIDNEGCHEIKEEDK